MIKYFAVVQYPTLPHGGIIDVISECIAAVPVNTINHCGFYTLNANNECETLNTLTQLPNKIV